MEAGGQGLCGRSEAALEGNVCTRKARAMVGCRHCRLEGAGGKEVEWLVPRMAARTVATATRFPTSRCPQVGVARGLQQALDGKAALKALGPPARPLPSLHFRISRSRDALVPAAPKAQELPSDELAIALDFGTSMLDTLQTQLGIAKADLPAPPPAHLAPGRPRHRQGQTSHRKSKSQAREHVRRRCPPPRNEAGDSGNQCGSRGLRSGPLKLRHQPCSTLGHGLRASWIWPWRGVPS
jgi:hypothetical protein